MNKNRYEYLTEKAKQLGKILLIEECVVYNSDLKIENLPAEKLVESTDGNTYKCRAILRNVPVSKFTENENGRVYPKELDEKIIREKTAEGTLSLADHPHDDSAGSVTMICGVWHDPRIGESFSYGDWYLVGNYGELIKETVEAGGNVGLSRVGFGSFLSDGKTVNPDDYILERWADAVILPSQGVYARKENLDTGVETKTESKKNLQKVEEKEGDSDKKSELLKEDITNKLDSNESLKNTENIKNIEKKDEVLFMTENEIRINEANFKNNVMRCLKEARKSDNIQESLDEVKAIEIPDHLGDLKEKANATITELQNRLSEKKESAEKSLKEFTDKYKKLNEKYSAVCKVATDLKDKYIKAKTLIEKFENSGKMDKVLKEKYEAMKRELSQYKKDAPLMESDIKTFKEERKRLIEKINKLVKRVKVLKEEDIDTAGEETVKTPPTGDVENDPYEFSFADIQEEAEDGEPVDDKYTGTDVDTDTGQLKQEEDEGEDVDNVSDDEIDFSVEDDLEKEEEVNGDDKEMDTDTFGKEDGDMEEDGFIGEVEPAAGQKGEYKYGPKDPEYQGYGGGISEEGEDGEDEEVVPWEDEETKDAPAKMPEKKKVTNIKGKIIREQITDYFASECKSTPALKDIKNKVINSKSLVEAVSIVNKFKAVKGKKDAPMKFKESKESSEKRPSWLSKDRL